MNVESIEDIRRSKRKAISLLSTPRRRLLTTGKIEIGVRHQFRLANFLIPRASESEIALSEQCLTPFFSAAVIPHPRFSLNSPARRKKLRRGFIDAARDQPRINSEASMSASAPIAW